MWPEKQNSSDTYAGVDALTYGLSTLVTSGGAIQAPRDCCVEATLGTACTRCSAEELRANRPTKPRKPLQHSHHLAQYVRRFSVANGPQECIEAYYVSGECGKMLGTLTALALARMPRLETFTWDMPTGISRDVWVALSSLGNLQDSRLHKLWMRCPETSMINDGDENLGRTGDDHMFFLICTLLTQETANAMNPARAQARRKPKRPKRPSNYLDLSYLNIESPSFSLLPPMKSITVLEMDEPAYLQELSMAIATSVDTLRELRIGVVSLFCGVDWAAADRIEVHTKKSTDPRLGFLTTGGVLGLLLRGIHDCRQGPKPTTFPDSSRPGSLLQRVGALVLDPSNLQHMTGSVNDNSNPSAISQQVNEAASDDSEAVSLSSPDTKKNKKVSKQASVTTKTKAKKLKLETLELESITIRSNVLRHSIQWECLTSLTLLNCGSDERLWKLFTSLYGPTHDPNAPQMKGNTVPTKRRGIPESDHDRRSSSTPMEYHLNLKKIHTNRVSFALLAFLKKALAPNSLEQVFLQETYPPTSKVTLDDIYHGPIRHHRMSLRKLMIDSVHSRDSSVPPAADPIGDPGNAASKGKKWAMSRKILSFITSGKMPKLRELAVVVDYKDWHFLLQGLPRIPHLRALYLPHIMNHPYGPGYEALELADQILSVATLRSEMELAYLAIWQRCFEILENNGEAPGTAGKTKDDGPNGAAAAAANNGVFSDEDSGEEEDDDVDDDDDDGDEHNDDGETDEDPSATHDDSSTFTSSEASSLSSDDCGGEVRSSQKKGKVKVKRLKLKLREILFYDDKVAVFKARHGKL